MYEDRDEGSERERDLRELKEKDLSAVRVFFQIGEEEEEEEEERERAEELKRIFGVGPVKIINVHTQPFYFFLTHKLKLHINIHVEL